MVSGGPAVTAGLSPMHIGYSRISIVEKRTLFGFLKDDGVDEKFGDFRAEIIESRGYPSLISWNEREIDDVSTLSPSSHEIIELCGYPSLISWNEHEIDDVSTLPPSSHGIS